MPRKPRAQAPAAPTPTTPATPAGPVTLHANTIYTLPQATAALGLRLHTLRREVRLGRLRVSRRGGRYFIRGAWLLDWLGEGEVRGKKATTDGEQVGE